MTLEGISGCGIGIRREFLQDLNHSDVKPDWIEITPENWIDMPFKLREDFYTTVTSLNTIAHGLSLSIGSPEPIEEKKLSGLRNFFNEYGIKHYSEHLSFSTWNGTQTYELLPVPMTLPMADFIADKIKRVMDYLGMPVIMENATYYFQPYSEMPEFEFINLVLQKADCPLLLDVNNVFVNSLNHKFNPFEFIHNLNLARTAYIHTAGHTYFPDDDITIDTHGSAVSPKVWELLLHTLRLNPAPVMIERDHNIPPFDEVISEYNYLKTIMMESNKIPFPEKLHV